MPLTVTLTLALTRTRTRTRTLNPNPNPKPNQVTQLLVNWREWCSGGGTMFEMGVEMLSREGYHLPEPTRMQDGSETPRGHPGAAAGAGPHVLLGQVGV